MNLRISSRQNITDIQNSERQPVMSILATFIFTYIAGALNWHVGHSHQLNLRNIFGNLH